MILKRFYLSAATVFFFCTTGVFAGTDVTDSTALAKKVVISGYGAIEIGKVVNGMYQFTSQPEVSNLWLDHVYGDLSIIGKVNDHFSANLSLEARVWYNTCPLLYPSDRTTFGPPAQNCDINIRSADGILSFGDKRSSALTVDFGRFEYKYNPQAQDLGEYMFRTGCYPAYIITNFDLPLARLNGILVSHSISDIFRQDLLFTTMTEVRPYFDFNLTYIADLSLCRKALDIGAGVSFDHLISVDSNETQRTDYSADGYLKAPGDTGFYTFSGTKIMARLSFDPKKLFDHVSYFGPNDGIIYGEAIILGVKNYPASNVLDTSLQGHSNDYGYDKILQKMPVMMGVNVPAFKLLDVLSVEGEWFGSKYADAYDNVMNRMAIPFQNPKYDPTWFLHDNWKWAITAKKTIYGGLSLIGMIGRDHLRTETCFKQYTDYGATLVTPNDRYWMVKIKYDL